MRRSPRNVIHGILPALLACFVFAAYCGAADASSPKKWPTLALKGGRVLHNVKLLEDEPDSVVVKSDEGLVKIAKSDLPADVATAYPARTPPTPGPSDMVMRSFDTNPADAVRQQVDPIQAPAAKSETKDPASSPKVFKGCTIVSFESKPYQTILGCAQVVIHNDTDTPVTLYPSDLYCTTDKLKYHGGTFLIEGDPPGHKNKEVVPPHDNVTDLVTFSNDSIEIASVEWMH